ncbi:hypothetical protein BDN70DRAFT_796695, partial [Pholiota conissans]
VVDEARVIEAWKEMFRKDYRELETLGIATGTEIPWLAFTATYLTKKFYHTSVEWKHKMSSIRH